MQPVMYNFHSNKSHIPPSLPFYQFKPPSSAHLRDPSLRFGMTKSKSGLTKENPIQLSTSFEFALQGFAFDFETANLAIDAVEFFGAAVYFQPQT